MCDKASLWLILENNPAHPKNMSKLILTDYINVASRGTNVKTGHQPIWVTLSWKSDLESDNESSFRKEHLKSEGFVVVQLKGTKTVFHYIVQVENYPLLRAKLKLSALKLKQNTERGQQDGMICHSRAFQDIEVPFEDAYWPILHLFI